MCRQCLIWLGTPMASESLPCLLNFWAMVAINCLDNLTEHLFFITESLDKFTEQLFLVRGSLNSLTVQLSVTGIRPTAYLREREGERGR